MTAPDATARGPRGPSGPRFAAVGAGRMGRGIAIAFAYAGHRVSLIDLRERSDEAWARLRDEARAEIAASLSALASLGVFAADRVDEIAARVDCVRAPDAARALAAAELIFEGVPETMEAKREAFTYINAHCRDDAILTSTTSSILVTQIAEFVHRPERFLNIHWLNPAYVIPVVELSYHAGTDPAVLARAKALMEEIGKLPVVCGPTPGYIVPRLQALVMNEAARMIEEGAATAKEIDKATRFGLGLRFAALGVVEFIDFGGCDILHHASREMSASIDAGRYTAPAILGRMMDEGRLGLKTGSGFYDYAGRDVPAYRRDVLQRTLGMLRHADLLHPPVVSSDTGPSEVSRPIRRAFADLSVGQIHYASCGDESAPAVLLLHQTPRSWAEYRTVLPLIGTRYRAIAMDTVGFGDSAAAPWPATIERWAQVAIELLDSLGIKSAHVVGHHTGGVIALEMAASQPARVRSLALSSTPFTDGAFRKAREGRPPIDHVDAAADGSHLTALWQKRQAFYPADRADLLASFVLDALKVSGTLEGGHHAVASYQMEDRIGRVTQPTLVIRAPADPFASPHAAELAAHIQGARVVDVPGGMVPLPDQLPAEFAAAVLEFIDGLPR